MRLPFSMMAATIPPAATRPTLGRQGVEPIRQRRKGGDCLVGPRPLRLQTCGGGEFELQRRIGDGGIDAGFTAVALAASMRPVGAAFGVAC